MRRFVRQDLIRGLKIWQFPLALGRSLSTNRASCSYFSCCRSPSHLTDVWTYSIPAGAFSPRDRHSTPTLSLWTKNPALRGHFFFFPNLLFANSWIQIAIETSSSYATQEAIYTHTARNRSFPTAPTPSYIHVAIWILIQFPNNYLTSLTFIFLLLAFSHIYLGVARLGLVLEFRRCGLCADTFYNVCFVDVKTSDCSLDVVQV